MHRAYICLGSNLGQPEKNLQDAVRRISELPGVIVDAASPVYMTEPQDCRNQPWFANQVLRVLCPAEMTAVAFLDMLLAVEIAMGRIRMADSAMRYGPRVIDLDLLLFDDEKHDTEHLTLPHPKMLQRAFVLVPLQDMDPFLILPGGMTPGEALSFLSYAVEGKRISQ